MRSSKAQSVAGGKSVAGTEYTADFTDFTEPFQTPRVCFTATEVLKVYNNIYHISMVTFPVTNPDHFSLERSPTLALCTAVGLQCAPLDTRPPF